MDSHSTEEYWIHAHTWCLRKSRREHFLTRMRSVVPSARDGGGDTGKPEVTSHSEPSVRTLASSIILSNRGRVTQPRESLLACSEERAYSVTRPHPQRPGFQTYGFT
ncbi:hypothetical protein EYF80_019334 [Liparis tanakae]|uniref:Uncharacterized protein n=1 Tax=Liparis tanakae TaxID=230148 RepID=A0A4Z2HXN5_9TELE|nr:hypothetical protein EYF80_019334 [Liparis tanakae]